MKKQDTCKVSSISLELMKFPTYSQQDIEIANIRLSFEATFLHSAFIWKLMY